MSRGKETEVSRSVQRCPEVKRLRCLMEVNKLEVSRDVERYMYVEVNRPRYLEVSSSVNICIKVSKHSFV